MHITHLLKHLRTTEGILREKLKLDDAKWQEAMEKFGNIVLDKISEEVEVSEDEFQRNTPVSGQEAL